MAYWIHSANASGTLTSLAKTDACKNYEINQKMHPSDNWYEITEQQYVDLCADKIYLTAITDGAAVFNNNSFADYNHSKEVVDSGLDKIKQVYQNFLDNNPAEHPARDDVQAAITAIDSFDSSTLSYPITGVSWKSALKDAGLSLVHLDRL
tara:strand:- start:192 stop:644 length:453 start_codon:yes stop_codon:yes gene_type:complete